MTVADDREAALLLHLFNQDTLRILGVAFEQTCIALRIGDCNDDVKQAIANKITT